jgi:hypothetical protein
VKQLKCVRCGAIKDASEFGSNSTSSTGYQSYCRECKNENHAKNQAANLPMRLRHHFYTRMCTTLTEVPDDLYTNMEDYLGYRFKELVRGLDKDCAMDYGFNLKKALNIHKFHIDHRKPLTLFLPYTAESIEFRECWAVSNLKAIPSSENLAKGSKFDS